MNKNNKYDIIHFEALSKEWEYLISESEEAINNFLLPKNHNFLVTPLTIQEFLNHNPDIKLPDIITIKTHSIIPDNYINNWNKKNIITRSAWYDHIEHISNIANITSLREYCVNAVAETAISFLFASSRKINHYSLKTKDFDRKWCETFLELTWKTVTVYWVGKIWKRIYDMLFWLWLNVQAVDIREKELSKLYKKSVNFISKEEAIKNTDIIINAMNFTKDEKSIYFNKWYFSWEYFLNSKNWIIFINVTRWEIAPESILLQNYKNWKIIWIWLDVFSDENNFSNLMKWIIKSNNKDLNSAKKLVKLSINRKWNIYVSPHQWFNSDIASEKKATETIKHLINYYKNQKKGFIEQIPYY